MTTITIRRSFAVITIATIGATTAVASGGEADGQQPPFPGEPSPLTNQHSAAYAPERIPRCFRVLWPTAAGPEEMVRCEQR